MSAVITARFLNRVRDPTLKPMPPHIAHRIRSDLANAQTRIKDAATEKRTPKPLTPNREATT